MSASTLDLTVSPDDRSTKDSISRPIMKLSSFVKSIQTTISPCYCSIVVGYCLKVNVVVELRILEVEGLGRGVGMPLYCLLTVSSPM